LKSVPYASASNKDAAHANCNSNPSQAGKVALFWDESFLWGLIAYQTFLQLHIDFELITSRDICEEGLDKYDVIFVPGGWASNKIKALGDDGRIRIRDFVANGGSYLGFCGGAGMALQHNDGISLLPLDRKPTSVRVPSFSGKIKLHQEAAGHPVWNGVPEGTAFHAWWPGQFSAVDNEDIKVLARYGHPEKGSFVADLLIDPSMDWDMWERSYGTNLNPGRIDGEPAFIEARYGSGKVLLSYLHFETPEDELGHKVLLNSLEYLAGGKPVRLIDDALPDIAGASLGRPAGSTGGEIANLAIDLEEAALDLISFGEKNFLWYWRNPWIIQWRRGVRGIEYCTLYAMLRQLSALAPVLVEPGEETSTKLRDLKELTLPFFEEAKQLLTLERYAMNYGPLSPLVSGDEQIQRIREKLFSNSKRFGGHYKKILDQIDDILFPLLKAAKNRKQINHNPLTL